LAHQEKDIFASHAPYLKKIFQREWISLKEL